MIYSMNKEDAPKISIIIPIFNREKTIIRSINSVLKQKLQPIEIIIVDDCSTDNSVLAIQSLDNPLIKLHLIKKNMGANYCRNYGISVAKGDYIAFQDSDDEWMEDKLSYQFNLLKEFDCDVVSTAVKTIFPNGQIKIEKKKSGKVDIETLLLGNYLSTQTLFMKRKVLENIKFDSNLKRFQDWDICLNILKNNFQLYYTDEILVNQYIQTNSISMNYMNAAESVIKIRDKYINFDTKKIKATHYYLIGIFNNKIGIKSRNFFFESLLLDFKFKRLCNIILIICGLK